MSKRQWLVLLMLFLIYLLLGAFIFYHIEHPLEVEEVTEARRSRIQINALLHEHYVPNEEHDQNEIFEKLTAYCGKPVSNYTEGEVDQYKWDFYNSFYFAYTVVSTIGYGNLAPTNMLGRILMIFYALIGIPMNGILLTQLGDYFGNVFIRAHQKYKSYKNGPSDSQKRRIPLETGRAGLMAQILMYLVPGFVMFIFFPSFLFSYWEGWKYDESVYYAFVTLSTIGFGDYVAGQDNTKGSGIFWMFYKAFLIIWISFGLGYLVMIMSFISRGMRSKRITRIEHKLAMNLKHTQSKIWNEVNKDVNYLRRVFNEIYMMKLKPVYRDEYQSELPEYKFARSHSFPDLRELVYGGREVDVPVHPRRRANSEAAQTIQYEAVNRVLSESDLERIDKNATFASHAMVQPAELLARLVTALGSIPAPPEQFDISDEETNQPELKGVDGFSDKDILASEKSWAGSGWRIGGEKVTPSQPRMRAASEIRLQKDDNGYGDHEQNTEWTWSGPAASSKIQELMKARQKSGNSTPVKGSKSRLPSFSLSSVPKTIRPRWFNPFSSKKNSGEVSRRESFPGSDVADQLKENYLSHTGSMRPMAQPDRRQSAAPHYFTHTGGNLPDSPEGNLLEETSLADFLRALTALHSRVGAVPDEFVSRPQRKLGTASLTPPKLPSLLALFSPPSHLIPQSQSTQSTVTAGQMAERRFSLRPVDDSIMSTPGLRRKASFLPGAGSRRFSLRPEESTVTSTQSYGRKGSMIPGSVPRRFSLKSEFTNARTSPHNTPPYTPDLVPLHIRERQNPPPYSADPFIFECPKEPLVPAEVGPAQDGISIPTRAKPRRFSLRPAQIGVPPAPASPKTSQMGRPIPRWKGGMLQRQISELNLQRRERAFSLGDVNSIRNERPVGQTSPLALPNTNLNSPSLTSSRSSLTDNIDKANSQALGKAVNTLVPSVFPTRTSRYARQSSAGFTDHLSSGQSLKNDKTEILSRSLQPAQALHGQGLVRQDQGALKPSGVGSTRFNASVQRVSPEVNAAQLASQNSNPFNPYCRVEQFSEAPEGSGQISTAIKIDDPKKSSATDRYSSLELHSVLIDQPSSKSLQPSAEQYVFKPDSLTEVRVDSPLTAAMMAAHSHRLSASESIPDYDMHAARKISVISEKSTASADASSDVEKSASRKTSTMSQRSLNSASLSESRKNSTSKSAASNKPRVSIESYKPLVELTIEKPATNPFEQYQATVKCKMERPRDRSLDSSEPSTSVKDSHRHSPPVSASEKLESTQSSVKSKNT
ncbi:open rectifier potassium channel protein 1 [Neodiprion lecontei]|uniref:Open rectifier potassium channel protein 1 n=1 Tax=Neodiprion lecontei TaxID=441921 RepID=A0ABM3G250_NEOLC|nr:open rectifier potassium channel protein 1 [Neodiprion lecontei]XP_046594346.1 open rectifier potassium channel protein 1 [Neodiprion lecontei]XP_046594347.1 open rectifier potassium channel protein 1 [Neodiprion lecontei]XP_046594348.1 open rectifier potassium channel protein 1 [Neodiprion lecontei]